MDWPKQVSINEDGQQVTYTLPPRPRSLRRYIMASRHAAMAVLLGALGIALLIVAASWRNNPDIYDAPPQLLYMLHLLPVVVLVAALWLAGRAAINHRGAAKLKCDGLNMRSLEKWSILSRHVSSVPLDQIKQLVVGYAPVFREQVAVDMRVFSGGSALHPPLALGALTHDDELVPLVEDYPLHWLTAIRDDLAGRFAIEIFDQPDETFGSDPLPDDSPVQVERTQQGLTVMLPPMGVRGFARTMIITAVSPGLIGIALALYALLASSMFAGALAVFSLLASSAMIGGAMLAGRSSTVIDLMDRNILVTHRGICRIRQHFIDNDDVHAICIGPAELMVDGRAVPELQVHRYNHWPIGLCAGRSIRELDAVRMLLCEELGLTSSPGLSFMPDAAE